MPEKRDIYTAKIYFNGRAGAGKLRPVVILNDFSNGWYTVVEITSISPKDPPSHFDSFKEPIIKWQECGLDESSWVKCHKSNRHNIESERLHKNIGIMDVEDFYNTIVSIYTKNQ